MGIIDKGVQGLQAISDAKGDVSDLISSKKEYVIKQVVNIFLLLIILVVFGCFDFLHLQFHFEYLLETNFWINVVTKAIADICAYNIGINFPIIPVCHIWRS